MNAQQTILQDILEGTKQYIVPLFQRTYSWGKNEWGTLWDDLISLYEMDNPRPHFIGSIVNMPTTSIPEGVSKYMLIDGQQRLTTLLLILILLRDKALEKGDEDFASEINNTLVVNPYKKENDYFKLMPTQVDRKVFQRLVKYNGSNSEIKKKNNQLTQAYTFFEKKLRQVKNSDFNGLKKIITNYFSVVSIVLDPDDNPHLVFESLNSKGRPLTHADLIRNYFFMRIHMDKQQEAYEELWKPMEEKLGEYLTEYIRHYLMKKGTFIKQTDVYYILKERVNAENAVTILEDLARSAFFYQRLLNPKFEKSAEIREQLNRLNRIEVTTAYPLLLTLYQKYDDRIFSECQFIECLKTIENFLIRRFICGIPTNQLNKIFPPVIPQLENKYKIEEFHLGLKEILQSKGYPKNQEFRSRLAENRMYGAGDRNNKTRLILETIESSYGHKENVDVSKLSIEHVMPQTLSEWWQDHLGDEWEVTYELYLHNIGNLTLTAYNAELYNAEFTKKKELYRDSHLEMNRYFTSLDCWRKEDIEKRAHYLSKKALEIWPYFGSEDYEDASIMDVTGTTPQALWILEQYFEVKNWRDVLENTLNTIAELEPEKFEILLNEYPKLISRDKNKFRAVRELPNSTYVEVNLSAQAIKRFCIQAMETLELTSEDWKIQTT